MPGLEAYAHDVYSYPLPPGHRFPLGKYRQVRERVDSLARVRVHNARAATRAELELGHDRTYVDRVEAGRLSRREELALGLPWSPELVERSRRSVGATISAAEVAIEDGVGANVGGGTHHAFEASGRGFCVFNDVVVAARVLRQRRLCRRVLVIDLDVHQGDGTHDAFSGDESAFTLSLNGFRNYPFRRVPGDLERDFADETGDDEYLEALRRLLPQAISKSRPQLAFYLAGADPYVGDRLGRLGLSKAGLATRDTVVRDLLKAAGIPVCATLAGGYADPIEDTVDINLRTIEVFA